MEGRSNKVSGPLPSRRNTHGPPRHFQGHKYEGNHHQQMTSHNQTDQVSPGYQNRYSRLHDDSQMSGDSAYNNRFNEKYFSHQQELPTGNYSHWHQYASDQCAQNRKRITCGPCNRTFYSQQRMDEHLKDHIECPFPECKLSAHIKVIDQHINNQHMLVNFAALQIDDDAWIAERKKRFPTAQRAELRRAQQIEKLKRGEKLGLNKKRFNDRKGGFNDRKGDKYFKKGKNDMQKMNKDSEDKVEGSEVASHGNEKRKLGEEDSSANCRFKRRQRQARPPGPSKPTIEVDLLESDEEVLGVKPFKGTKQFYESTGEVTYFSSRHFNKKSPEKEFAISDDDEWETENKHDSTDTGTLVLGGALGSLMGAYSDSEEENDHVPVCSIKSEGGNSVAAESLPSAMKAVEGKTTVCQSNIEDKKVDGQSNNGESSRFKGRRRPRAHKRPKGPNTGIVRRPPKRRKTLLERLLLSDIIHERNVILQCVRYIVENNFFDDKINKDSNGEPKVCEETNTVLNEILEKEENVTAGQSINDVTKAGMDSSSDVRSVVETVGHKVDSLGMENDDGESAVKNDMANSVTEENKVSLVTDISSTATTVNKNDQEGLLAKGSSNESVIIKNTLNKSSANGIGKKVMVNVEKNQDMSLDESISSKKNVANESKNCGKFTKTADDVEQKENETCGKITNTANDVEQKESGTCEKIIKIVVDKQKESASCEKITKTADDKQKERETCEKITKTADAVEQKESGTCEEITKIADDKQEESEKINKIADDVEQKDSGPCEKITKKADDDEQKESKTCEKITKIADDKQKESEKINKTAADVEQKESGPCEKINKTADDVEQKESGSCEKVTKIADVEQNETCAKITKTADNVQQSESKTCEKITKVANDVRKSSAKTEDMKAACSCLPTGNDTSMKTLSKRSSDTFNSLRCSQLGEKKQRLEEFWVVKNVENVIGKISSPSRTLGCSPLGGQKRKIEEVLEVKNVENIIDKISNGSRTLACSPLGGEKRKIEEVLEVKNVENIIGKISSGKKQRVEEFLKVRSVENVIDKISSASRTNVSGESYTVHK